MKRPFFSIIVSVYNVTKYLDECIASILSQSVHRYEIIMVDDGSTDDSGDKCDMYKEKNPEKVQVIHTVNKGPLAACCTGIANATGEYICFVDADDCWMPQTLQTIAKIIKENNIDCLLFRWKQVDANSREIDEDAVPVLFEDGFVNKEQIITKMVQSTYLNPLWSKVIRRELFCEIVELQQFYYLRKGIDLLVTISILKHASSFYYTKRQLYLYRINQNSISHTYRPYRYRVLKVIRPRLYEAMSELGYDSEENNKAFFQMYLKSIWLFVWDVCRYAEEKEKEEAFEEIRQYRLVIQAEEYLDISHLPKMTKRGLQLYYAGQWNALDDFSKLKNIKWYFNKRNYQYIAIYGIGNIGRLLAETLRETNIQILYGIDRNSNIGNLGISILSPNDNLPDVDAVIVTPVSSFTSIAKELSQKLLCPIISFEEVVDEL